MKIEYINATEKKKLLKIWNIVLQVEKPFTLHYVVHSLLFISSILFMNNYSL